MSTLAQRRAIAILPNWVEWLRRELAPFPGRVPMTIRIIVTVAIVTATSMALQVPQLAVDHELLPCGHNQITVRQNLGDDSSQP